jgi:DNA polymerase III epsilon subunit-like protein
MTLERDEVRRLAQELLAKHPMYLDTETTGLKDRDEVIEICVLDSNGRVSVESLVKPTVPISLDAGRVHGITQEMLQDAPSWPEIWPDVHQVLEGREIAIYNVEYDLRLIRQSHRAHGMPWTLEQTNFHCLMLLYARFYGRWNHRRGGFQWQSLELAAQQSGISLFNTHRAKDDAALARAILLHMAT